MFSEYKIVKMSSSETAPKKSKIVSHGRALPEGYHIFFAVKLDEYRNNIQKLLDILSDLSVAKAYYSTFDVHCNKCVSKLWSIEASTKLFFAEKSIAKIVF